MHVTLYSMLIWTSGILVASLTAVIFFGSRKHSSRLFSLSIFWVSVWIVSVGFLVASTNNHYALFFLRSAYFFGEVISVCFLLFFLSFPEDKKINFYLSSLIIVLQMVLGYLFIFTDILILSVFPEKGPTTWGWVFGSSSYIFEIIFFSCFVIGILNLYKKFKHCRDFRTRKNLAFMLIAIVIGTFPPSIICIILPRLNSFSYDAWGPITEIIWIPIISYSILKYQQMHVRAVLTEVVAIAMTAIFFLNIFIDIPLGISAKISTFVAFLALAYYLIKSVLKESQQREQLDDLNRNLEKRVVAQTVEIRKAYETEMRTRQELEKLNDAKDQFIMITQHHLRAPVSGINSALDSLFSGQCGVLTDQQKMFLSDTREQGRRLIRIVDDFLNITTIKIGTNILNLEQRSLLPSIIDIFAELQPELSKMHVSMLWDQAQNSWPSVPVDVSKIREAMFIIFENAVRYNKKNGSVAVTTRTYADDKKNVFEIKIDNTGLGISKKDSEKIGNSLFYRSEFARKVYPIGMGIGLSVVKAIIRAHKGSFKISSGGTNQGAQVIVTLPFTRD